MTPPIEWNEPQRRGSYWQIEAKGIPRCAVSICKGGHLDACAPDETYTLSDLLDGERRLREAMARVEESR